MNKNEKIKRLSQRFDVIGIISLDEIMTLPIYSRRQRLEELLVDHYKKVYENNQRLLFVIDKFDASLCRTMQQVVNLVDISNFFCILLLNGRDNIETARSIMATANTDPVHIEIDHYVDEHQKLYDYNSADPLKIDIAGLSDRHKDLLTKSKVFCIYPWIHLHTYPTGDAWPCCHAEMKNGPVGSCKTQSLKEIWNNHGMKKLRTDMLTEQQNSLCVRCYEQEQSGFFSGRQSANKHHGHQIHRVNRTQEDGTYTDFHMTYWDIRFSNLCNLRCRSCGHIFSSQWYQDQAKLAGPEWKIRNQVLNYAGRTETDMWEQLVPHLDYVEQIYFAGGEPLMMEEHYQILEELERRERFDVRLIYNTNFTHVKLKDRVVFDYWKRFDSVAVGASLDAMGPRAEYIRKGTDWSMVERNREQMLETCPEVDFYISPTLSIMNAWHLPDFHRDWVDRGLIQAKDLNVNILQDPPHYRIDIAPMKYKQRLRVRFEEHIDWLRPQDKLNRASVGFESAITFMMATDNTQLIERFWNKTDQLDQIRQERLLDILPELAALREHPAQ